MSPSQDSLNDPSASLHPSASQIFEGKMGRDGDLISRSDESQITIA